MESLVTVLVAVVVASQASAATRAQSEMCAKANTNKYGYSKYHPSDLNEQLGYERWKRVDPRQQKLNKTEIFMMQEAINSDRAMAEEEALELFKDAEGHITYYIDEDSEEMIAHVSHYPGDNEFGAIFEVQIHESGKKFAKLFAGIEDSDVRCEK